MSDANAIPRVRGLRGRILWNEQRGELDVSIYSTVQSDVSQREKKSGAVGRDLECPVVGQVFPHSAKGPTSAAG